MLTGCQGGRRTAGSRVALLSGQCHDGVYECHAERDDPSQAVAKAWCPSQVRTVASWQAAVSRTKTLQQLQIRARVHQDRRQDLLVRGVNLLAATVRGEPPSTFAGPPRITGRSPGRQRNACAPTDVARMDVPPGLTVPGKPLPGARHRVGRPGSALPSAARDRRRTSLRSVLRARRGVAARPDFCHLMAARLDDK